MTFFAWLWSLLAMLTAHPAPAPVPAAPAPVVHLAPARSVAPAPAASLTHLTRRSAPHPSAAATVAATPPATPSPGEQLPSETDGRVITCPDGVTDGVMRGGVVTGCPVTPTR